MNSSPPAAVRYNGFSRGFLAGAVQRSAGSSVRFGYLTDTHINLGDFIPGGIIYNAGLRQIEDALEGSHGIGSALAVDPISGNRRDCRIIAGDPV